MQEREPITLSTLGGGAVEELFQEELERVLRNIADPNTEPEALREITLKVKVRPNKDRSVGDLQVVPSSKLAPNKTFSSVVYMGRHQGQLIAQEHNPQQLSFESTDHIRALPAGEKE